MSESMWKRNVHLPTFKAIVTVREIQGFLAELYGTEVGRTWSVPLRSLCCATSRPDRRVPCKRCCH